MAKSKDKKVTRICVVKDPTTKTLNILVDVASRLGHLRSDVWNQYGSLKAWNITKITLDPIHRNSHPEKYGIPTKLWEATFYDCIDNIHAVQAASIVFAMRGLGLHPKSAEGQRVKKILSSRDWFEYPILAKNEELKELKVLHRIMYLVASVTEGHLQLSEIVSSDLIRSDVKKRFFKVWADLQLGATNGMGSPKSLDSQKPHLLRAGQKGRVTTREHLSSLKQRSQVNA